MKVLQAGIGAIVFNLALGAGPLSAQTLPPPPPGAAGSGGAAAASTAAAEPSAALIEFDHADFNWGRVESGTLVKHTFIVSNAGNAVLHITNVHPSCGCTTAGARTLDIEPGKTGAIPIQFNSARYSSSATLTKSVDVYSNAKNHPHETLFLRGIVFRSIEVTPPSPIISVLTDRTNAASTTVKIVCHANDPIELSAPVSSSKSFAVDLETVTPGKEYKATISALPPFAVGTFATTISFRTTSPTVTNFEFNALVTVQPEIQVSPPQLRLGALPSVWTTNRGVFIKGNGSNTLVLSDVQCSDARLHAQLNPIGVQGMYNLWVSLPPNYQIEPGQKVEITAKSNNPHTPVVTVPVVQMTHGIYNLAQPNWPAKPIVANATRGPATPAAIGASTATNPPVPPPPHP